MGNKILLAVHPGYASNSAGWLGDEIEEKYGKYESYLGRLRRAVRARRDCILLMYKDDELPFGVPEEAEIIRDTTDGYEELIERLKSRAVTDIDLCGEFLWSYGRSVKMEDVKEVTKTWPDEKKAELYDILQKKGKLRLGDLVEVGVANTEPFTKLLVSFLYDEKEVRGGCVETAKDNLKGFSVRIVRELCYPTKDPKSGLQIKTD
jgi:hypothetical protein